jgi:hypothetical protein
MIESKAFKSIESDEWDTFERMPNSKTDSTTAEKLTQIAKSWRDAIATAKVANRQLEDYETGIRKLFCDVPVGRTGVLQLGDSVCAVLKTHERFSWDHRQLKSLLEDNEAEIKALTGSAWKAVKVSIDRKQWDLLPEKVKDILKPALKPIHYDRLTFAEVSSEEEANKLLETSNV